MRNFKMHVSHFYKSEISKLNSNLPLQILNLINKEKYNGICFNVHKTNSEYINLSFDKSIKIIYIHYLKIL